MITEAFQHIRGVGPVRMQQLQQLGVRNWHDAVACEQKIPPGIRQAVVGACRQALEALETDDIAYFADTLHPLDRWRMLTCWLNQATYFDIETTGLSHDDGITIIVCWHRNQLHTFVEHENLDDILDLLDDVRLLVSFNGSSFDVPRMIDGFHIPNLPCAHLDLRWPCFYRGLHGGLKQVTSKLGLERPMDLSSADGDLAVRLWNLWQAQQDSNARNQLIRYCAADVLLLKPLAEHIAGVPMTSAADLWQHLPPASPSPLLPTGDQDARRRILAAKFGSASPRVLRTRR
ncbi:MAG: ribonuclease H-like domain-containing protein [Planctomycetaceae bacterium]